MESGALREATSQLSAVLTFLLKLKLDKKLTSEKDTLIESLKKTLEKCRKIASTEEGEVYNDVVTNDSEVYNDVEGKVEETTYNDTAQPNDVYTDTVADQQDEYTDLEAPTREIAPIPCEELTTATMCNHLHLKSKSMLMGAWQKRWCVLDKNVFYMYDSSKDKKQKEAFSVVGFSFQVRDDITKEAKRKERCFELKNDKLNKVYCFCASDKESLQKWKKVLSAATRGLSASHCSTTSMETVTPTHGKKSFFNIISSLGSKNSKSSASISEVGDDSVYDDTGPGETYDDLDILPPNGDYTDTGASETYMDTAVNNDDVYEDTQPPEENYEDLATNPAPDPTKRNLPLPPPSLGPKPGKSLGSPLLPPRDRSPSRSSLTPTGESPGWSSVPKLPPRSPTGGAHIEESGSASGAFNRKELPVPDKSRNLPPVPGNKHEMKTTPLPPSPIPSPPGVIDDVTSQEDYENMYQGMWDLIPDENNELALKRGEICHVISKVGV
uniref:src kinase-associated phosphoprotein 2-like isoform X2 n=1 Tax=Ciona intestinalis TaxID=7719 RepID=UPI000EF5282E|nr:src kinase-associated phosphoprotein 2-like isoform X2 [Ciona intestinalis]|eukprot:XP_026691091.1 src kinase-associated phosphoprotein 2-like isoform X2 [Ciona intestinalis]